MIGVRMVNDRVINRSLTSFDALIITDLDIMNWEGIPEMTPFVELRMSPVGSDPDKSENDISSPLTVGVMENDSFFVNTYDDWG